MMTRDKWTDEQKTANFIRFLCSSGLSETLDKVVKANKSGELKDSDDEKLYYECHDIIDAVHFAKNITLLAQVDNSDLPTSETFMKLYNNVHRKVWGF